MTIRSLILSLILVLAVIGLLWVLSYIWIALVAIILGSFLIEWVLCKWDLSLSDWASAYADDIAERLNSEMKKIEADDDEKRIKTLRRHIVDALLYAVRV